MNIPHTCQMRDQACLWFPRRSHFGISGPFAAWMLLGIIAFQVAGELEWDSKNLHFTNSAEANRYVKPVLKPVFRKGWELRL
jgi:hypothetical protein